MYIKLVTDYLDQAVRKYPEKIGFRDEKRSINFRVFRDESYQIANELIKRQYRYKPVAIFLDKSIECLTSAFGVVYSGNFYTIIDTEMPFVRIKKICDILCPQTIITDKKHLNQLKDIDVDLLLIDEFKKYTYDVRLIENVLSTCIDTDVVYVLFTSGSTGDPKGVIISHRNIITYMEWSHKAFGFTSETIFGNQTPFYFSMSVLDIYQTVYCGAELVIIPKKLFSFPVELLKFIQDSRINTIYWVPSALCQVANMGVVSRDELKGIHTVLFAGEVMPTKQINMWRRALPNAMYANLFGPTEVTDICSYYILNRILEDTEPIPIGNACDNMNIFIVDNNNNIIKNMDIGELYVRGSSVAYGYYNNIEKTREVFVQNPLNLQFSERVYRTGDLVHYNELGELIYVSRKDFQIKHMGYRIELGEIETIVSAIDGIERNCCIYDLEKKQIVLFYTGDVEALEIKRQLRKSLPKYMIPNIFKQLEKLPLNMNGKIDRHMLIETL